MTETVTIVCKCRVITPMFSSGADQTECEIRVPEIKAAMRFWWRAANSNLKLKELKEREALIFGGSGDDNARKSSFTMRVEYDQKDFKQYTQNDWNRELIQSKYEVKGTSCKKVQTVNLFDYLAFGVSVYDKEQRKNLLQRAGIAPESKFDLIVCVDKEFKTDVEECLKLFSCFGAVGAKSRNGFGRVVIEGYKSSVKDLCLRYSKISELPEYTAFSKEFVSLFKTKSTYETWHEALFQIGKAYREARVGKNGRSGLLNDHYTGKNRQYIALPLTVMNLKNREKPNPTKDDYDKIQLKQLGLDRMAKQFFMIVEPENGGFRGYILHLPFDFKNAVKNYKQEFSDNYDSAYIKMCTIFSENSNLEEV